MTFTLKKLASCSFLVMLGTTLLGCTDNQTNTLATKPTIEANPFVASVHVTNPSTFERADQGLYLSYHDLGMADPLPLRVLDGGVLVASQAMDKDFDGDNDGVWIVTSLEGGQTKLLTIELSEENTSTFEKRTQAEISHKEGGEWLPHSKYPNSDMQEYVGGTFKNVKSLTPPVHYTDHSNWIRYEGPGIESDKVAYRIYLDWRNGFDIFGKVTSQPALQEIGQDGYDSYHEMNPWGMDILKVGQSLGAGGFGEWHEEELHLISEVERWTANINDDGAVRSALSIHYQGWESSVGKQDLTTRVEMVAGSRLAKTTLQINNPVKAMAAGVVKHKETEFIQGDVNITGKAFSYIASWGKQSLDGSALGMAVFFKKENLAKIVEDESNYLAVLNPKTSPTEDNRQAQQLEYYFAAVWEKESGISTKEEFVAYLEQQTERLTVQPRLRLKTAISTASVEEIVTAESALNWSRKLADSEIVRKGDTYNYDGWDVHRQRPPKFEYDIVGLYPFTLYQLGELTGESSYQSWINKITGTFVTEQGDIKRYKKSNYNIDSVAPGRAVLALYQSTGEEKYKKAAALLRQQLAEHPKTTEGAFWHKKKYTHQLWLDGVYMGMPFLAEYSNLFEQSHSLDEVVNEFLLTRKYLRNGENGLYSHGWDESKQQDWADEDSGLSPEFWARGMGWYAMALIDVLQLIPEEQVELRAPLIEIAQEVASALVDVQDQTTGTWWQILDKPNEVGNYRESSATAMFVYFLAAAVDNGYIDKHYQNAAIKGYQGLVSEFILVHADGTISMTNQCYVAGLGFGRNGSYQYYMSEPVWQNDPKGNVPFILAGMAIHKLLAAD